MRCVGGGIKEQLSIYVHVFVHYGTIMPNETICPTNNRGKPQVTVRILERHRYAIA